MENFNMSHSQVQIYTDASVFEGYVGMAIICDKYKFNRNFLIHVPYTQQKL